MNQNILQKIISTGSLILIIAHLIWPQIAIDLITITLLIIAIVPWTSWLFKSLELPGGIKVEYRDLEKITEEATGTDLLKAVDKDKAYYYSIENNPDISLAWLRIEIEKRIRILNSLCNFSENKNFSASLEHLQDNKIIDRKEYNILRDLRGTLNKAAHGIEVEPKINDWAFTTGLSILSALDEKIKIYEDSCNL